VSSRLSTGEGYLYTENTVKEMKLQAEELNIDVLNLSHLIIPGFSPKIHGNHGKSAQSTDIMGFIDIL